MQILFVSNANNSRFYAIMQTWFNHATTTHHHIGEESPTAEAKRKAEAASSKPSIKGKWLKITRKGLLVSAIGRVGKQV